MCSGLVGLWRMHQAFLFCACTGGVWLERCLWMVVAPFHSSRQNLDSQGDSRRLAIIPKFASDTDDFRHSSRDLEESSSQAAPSRTAAHADMENMKQRLLGFSRDWDHLVELVPNWC